MPTETDRVATTLNDSFKNHYRGLLAAGLEGREDSYYAESEMYRANCKKRRYAALSGRATDQRSKAALRGWATRWRKREAEAREWRKEAIEEEARRAPEERSIANLAAHLPVY